MYQFMIDQLPKNYTELRANRSYTHKMGFNNYQSTDLWPNFMKIIIPDFRSIVSEFNIKNFLDVGCGYGRFAAKVKMMFDFNVHGLEMVKEYSLFAKQFIKTYNINAFKFIKYDKYDLIYMFNPIYDFTLKSKLVNLIFSKMKVGAILYQCCSVYRPRISEYETLKTGWPVFGIRKIA